MRFRIGQRVKKVAPPRAGINWVPIGSEGTIVGHNLADDEFYLLVRYDGIAFPDGDSRFHAAPYMLAPLTDPGFDAFMSKLLKDIREPLPLDNEQLKEIRS